MINEEYYVEIAALNRLTDRFDGLISALNPVENTGIDFTMDFVQSRLLHAEQLMTTRTSSNYLPHDCAALVSCHQRSPSTPASSSTPRRVKCAHRNRTGNPSHRIYQSFPHLPPSDESFRTSVPRSSPARSSAPSHMQASRGLWTPATDLLQSGNPPSGDKECTTLFKSESSSPTTLYIPPSSPYVITSQSLP